MATGVQWTGTPSKVLTTWIEKPRVMLDLGRRLLVELSDSLKVHVGRDYRGDMMVGPLGGKWDIE